LSVSQAGCQDEIVSQAGETKDEMSGCDSNMQGSGNLLSEEARAVQRESRISVKSVRWALSFGRRES